MFPNACLVRVPKVRFENQRTRAAITKNDSRFIPRIYSKYQQAPRTISIFVYGQRRGSYRIIT